MFEDTIRSFVMSIVRGRNFEISNNFSSCYTSDTISFKKKKVTKIKNKGNFNKMNKFP